LIGALMVAWRRRQRDRKTAAQRRAEERLNSEVLRNLTYLTGRVAGDIESHNSQVADVSEELATAESGPGVVKEAVQRLLKANHQIQEKLSQTEEQLREQATKMASQLAVARTDPLTLLGSRRALEEELRRCMIDFHVRGGFVSLVNVDLDDFKNVNEVHGHVAGDEVLRGLAKVFRRCLPENAFVARVGGDEFTILLPNAPLVRACTLANDAREAVKTSCFSFNGNKLAITASFGVAELRNGEDASALYYRADQALAMSARRGRNTVYWHDGKNVGQGLPGAAAEIQTAAMPLPPQTPAEKAPQPAPVKAEVCSPAAEDLGGSYNLANRTMFCNSVRSRVSEWKRGGTPISIVLVKIRPRDKSPAGGGAVPARMLHEAATHIQSVVREMDLAGYYAQACFSLLIPAVDPVTAENVGGRVEEQLSHLAAKLGGAVDLCVGTATVSEGDDAVKLLKRAENDLLTKDRLAESRSLAPASR
jgi:diguanylate cyclase